jgi:hypothetical protein
VAVEIKPVFDLISSGSLTAAGTDNWVDLCSFAPNTNSPIPSGKRLYIGYVTCISQDKNATFELRPNLPTKSAANTTDTQLRGFVSVATGESKDLDLYYAGAIASFAPVTADSTGVEKLWLRIKSGSSSSATYEFIFYYALYG